MVEPGQCSGGGGGAWCWVAHVAVLAVHQQSVFCGHHLVLHCLLVSSVGVSYHTNLLVVFGVDRVMASLERRAVKLLVSVGIDRVMASLERRAVKLYCVVATLICLRECPRPDLSCV